MPLFIGAAGIAISLFMVGLSFQSARYNLTSDNFVELKQAVQMKVGGEEHIENINQLVKTNATW